MKNIINLIFIACCMQTLYAHEEVEKISAIAKKLNLYGGQKATIQWKRVFSSQRHLRRYNLQELPLQTRNKLKKYLIEHAADSDQPIVPGL